MTDKKHPHDEEVNTAEPNTDAPNVQTFPLHDWGDEILKRMYAAGHRRPGIFIAIHGDDDSVSTVTNMHSEPLGNFLKWLTVRHLDELRRAGVDDPIEQAVREMGGRKINRPGSITIFQLEGDEDETIN